MILLAGCGPEAEESPKTLEELTQLALRDFWSDAAAEHVAGIEEWMAENVDNGVDGYYFEALPEEVVADIEHDAAIVWEECLGAAVVHRVDGTLADYAQVATEADQSFADPTYSRWERTIIEGTAEGFVGGEDMKTDNDVEKSYATVSIPYRMYKDFRWFGETLAAVTWVPAAGYNAEGDNGIVGGFTVEIWVDDGGSVVWYNGQWSDLDTVLDPFISPDGARDLLIDGTIDYMDGTAEHVADPG